MEENVSRSLNSNGKATETNSRCSYTDIKKPFSSDIKDFDSTKSASPGPISSIEADNPVFSQTFKIFGNLASRNYCWISSVTTGENNSGSINWMRQGPKIIVTGGVCNGSKGIFIKNTPKRIMVCLDNGDVKYLHPKNVTIDKTCIDTIRTTTHYDGTIVDVIGGKHKGKTVGFVKCTPKGFTVRLDNGKTVNLKCKNIQERQTESCYKEKKCTSTNDDLEPLPPSKNRSKPKK